MLLTYSIQPSKTHASVSPLTTSDIALLVGRVASKYSHNKLLCPSEEMYAPSPSIDQAYSIWHQLAAHIGIKHSTIAIHIDSSSRQTFIYSATKRPQLTIGTQSLSSNFILAGVIAHMFCIYLLETKQRTHIETDVTPQVVQLLGIRLGFGVIMANALAYDSLPPGYTKEEFAHKFRLFTSENRIVNNAWLSAALPSALGWLSSSHTPHTTLLPSIQQHISESKQTKWRHLLLLPLVLFIASCIVLVHSRAQQASETLKKQKITAIIQSDTMNLQACKELAEYQQSHWPDDIFIERNINETLIKCKSLERTIQKQSNTIN